MEVFSVCKVQTAVKECRYNEKTMLIGRIVPGSNGMACISALVTL